MKQHALLIYRADRDQTYMVKFNSLSGLLVYVHRWADQWVSCPLGECTYTVVEL